MRLIGIDCAAKSRNVGIALADTDGEAADVRQVLAGIREPWEQVALWLVESEQDTLIAIDAPLGWPQPLAATLQDHRAGSRMARDSNDLFRRATDKHIRERTGKQPLDVGADRIARTAHAALAGVDLLARKTSLPMPLAWSPQDLRRTSVIEVYPAATLKSHGLPFSGYKDPGRTEHRLTRSAIVSGMSSVRLTGACLSTVLENADALDAVACVLAARDFVRGECMSPVDHGLAVREGWIWCRRHLGSD